MLKQKLKQPKALPILFFTEMWERFGFYAVQALFVLFLTNKLLFSDRHAAELFGAFGALLYISTIIGGYLADHYIGFKRSIYVGGILYIIGYSLLTSGNQQILYIALAFLIAGMGFFKSCVSSLLGLFYQPNDPRRDSGFTIFYMGINVGSFFAPIFCAYLSVEYGYHIAFGSAAVGMIIGMATYYFGRYKLMQPHATRNKKRSNTTWKFHLTLIIGILIAISIITISLHYPRIVNDILFVLTIIIFLWLLNKSRAKSYSQQQRRHIIVLLILIISSIVFWAFYMQTYISFTLFTERVVNRELVFHFFAHTIRFLIPTASIPSIEAFFLLLLSPFFASLWLKLAKNKYNPSIPKKFALSLILLSFMFFFTVLGMKLTGAANKISLIWIVFAVCMQAIGELCISPIGLSAITELSPPNMVGSVMGIWFVALGISITCAGKIAQLTAIPKSQHHLAIIKSVYFIHFLYFGLACLLGGILLFLITPKIEGLMH